ncbi:BRISC and BRCA1-A complex member 2-like [Zophobas morio]|uniref:BRISC and BRCA1-A complex member 2-like n=1 Tax=Zophobas morio TaxID=2755281 RepID=UPI003082A47C
MKMDFLAPNNENLLANFPPVLRGNFRELFCRGKIGLSSLSLNDITPTKQFTDEDSSYSYYYTVRIPYAGKRLSWELIFDPNDLTFAPDFNFNDETFRLSTEIEAVVKNVPTLISWNVTNSGCLTSLLNEFVNLFKIQQLEKLQKENIYAQLHSEYQILTEEVPEHDIEVYLDNTSAHFLINIKVDVSALPEYLQPMKNGEVEELLNPGDDTCILKISFMKLDGSRVNVSLQLSPRLDQVLNSAKNLHVPAYPKTASLADYVNLVAKMLQDHALKIEQHHKLKKEYILSLCTMYGEHLVEFDTDTFSKAELLFQVDGYSCLVRVEIGALFPDEPPTVHLLSLYCVSNKVCSEQVVNYLYSPRWSPENMCSKLILSLKETIPKFKNHKH